MQTTRLITYIERYESLSPFEFEEMVAEWVRTQGWTNVSVTPKTGDMGKDVIGTDLDGKIVYIEVKKHKDPIGRPVVQKLHSIMVIDQISRGMIITTSIFSKDAIEYARISNIELITGTTFFASCNMLIKNALDYRFICTPIDWRTMRQESKNHFDRIVFSHPNTLESLTETISIGNFKFDLDVIVAFSLKNQGSYDKKWMSVTGQKDLTADPHPNKTTIHELSKKWAEEGFHLNGSITPITFPDSQLKKLIRVYYYEKLGVYPKPADSDIDLHEIYYYYAQNASCELHTPKGFKIKVAFYEGKIFDDGLTRYILCQDCQRFFTGNKFNKMIGYCRNCGKIVCNECAYVKSTLGIIHQFWCKECGEKVKQKLIPKSINQQTISTLMVKYQQWALNQRGNKSHIRKHRESKSYNQKMKKTKILTEKQQFYRNWNIMSWVIVLIFFFFCMAILFS